MIIFKKLKKFLTTFLSFFFEVSSFELEQLFSKKVDSLCFWKRMPTISLLNIKIRNSFNSILLFFNLKMIINIFHQKKKVLLLVIVSVIVILFIFYQIMLYDLELLTESKMQLQLEGKSNGRIRGLRSIVVDFCVKNFDDFNEFLEKKIYSSIRVNDPLLGESWFKYFETLDFTNRYNFELPRFVSWVTERSIDNHLLAYQYDWYLIDPLNDFDELRWNKIYKRYFDKYDNCYKPWNLVIDPDIDFGKKVFLNDPVTADSPLVHQELQRIYSETWFTKIRRRLGL